MPCHEGSHDAFRPLYGNVLTGCHILTQISKDSVGKAATEHRSGDRMKPFVPELDVSFASLSTL